MQQSIADEVFLRLEEEILNGTYKRGDLLSENKLAEKFGVSRTPVREAIKRLEQEDLIAENGKVVAVLGISEKDVADVYEIRLKIEADAAIRAAHRMTRADFEELSEIIDLQEFYARKQNADSVRDADSDFHLRIYELSESDVYRSVLSGLHKKIQRYRKISQSRGGRGEKSIGEHRAILEAMSSLDDEKIRALIDEHLVNARDNILKNG